MMRYECVVNRVIAIVLLSLLTSVQALAQPAGTRRVTFGAAAGIALPFHGDLDFTAPAWQGDVRIDTSRHFGFGLFFEEWRHAGEEIYPNQTITGPSGVLGHVDRVTARTVHRTYTVGWNFLGRGSAGRLTVTGGGGAGFFLHSRDYTQTMTGCEPASLCRDYSQTFSNGSFSAQAQAGADVAISRRVAVMGQFRLVMPVEDAGSGHNTLVAGIRFGF
jgi:hypothetical protein